MILSSWLFLLRKVEEFTQLIQFHWLDLQIVPAELVLLAIFRAWRERLRYSRWKRKPDNLCVQVTVISPPWFLKGCWHVSH